MGQKVNGSGIGTEHYERETQKTLPCLPRLGVPALTLHSVLNRLADTVDNLSDCLSERPQADKLATLCTLSY